MASVGLDRQDDALSIFTRMILPSLTHPQGAFKEDGIGLKSNPVTIQAAPVAALNAEES